MNTAPQTPLDQAVKRLEDAITVITPLHRPLTLYPQNKDILMRDLRTVLDALAKAREGQGEWMVKSSDYDRLLNAALGLRSACMHKLPPSLYAALENECRAIDVITKPAPSQ